MSGSPPPLAPVGFIGLGKMGLPMCRRLLAAGVPVIGYDPVADASALATLGRFTAVPDVSELAARVSTVILMLPNSDVVDSVVLEQLAGTLPPESLIVDMSSSVPDRTRTLAERLVEHELALVDAPVSGGVSGATTGNLTVMVGGSAVDVERARPLLIELGQRIEHVGSVGAGHAVKALNNLMSAAHLWASSEALLAAQRFGLDVATALKVVNASSGRSASTANKWPNFVLTERFDSGFALNLMLKDVTIALDLIESVGVPSPVSTVIAAMWKQADADLGPGADHTEVVRWLERGSAETRQVNANMAP